MAGFPEPRLACRPCCPADTACKTLGAALAEQSAWLAADADAAQRLFEVLLGADDEPPQQLAPYALPSADAAGLGSALLAAAEAEAAAAGGSGGGSSAVALHVARQLLAFAVEWAPAEQLLASCQKLLAAGAAVAAPAAGSPEAAEREGLLSQAAACFTARRLEQLLQGPQSAGTAAVLDAWCALLEPTGAAGAAPARLAALQQVQQRPFELLPTALQGRCLKVSPGLGRALFLSCLCCCWGSLLVISLGCLHPAAWSLAHGCTACLPPCHPQVLLRAASKDPDEACRGAARAALAALPLQADALLPLLAEGAGGGDAEMADAAGPQAEEEQDEVLQQLLAAAAAAAAKVGTPRAKQRRGKGSQEEQAAAEAAAAVERRRQQLAAQRAARQHGRAAAEHQQGGAAPPAVAGGSEECVAALELLQWKDNVQQHLLLVPALQAVLEHQLAQLSAAAAAAASIEDEQQPAEQGAAAAEVVYVVQLCLSALRSIAAAQHQAAGGVGAAPQALPSAAKAKGKKGKAAAQQQQQQQGREAFDLGLAVRAAQLAPDGAVRNAALALVAELASGMPQVGCWADFGPCLQWLAGRAAPGRGCGGQGHQPR